MVLFPTWVSLLPEVGCQEISAPLAHEKAASRSGAANAVRSLSKIPKESRGAVELAQSGQYAQAATAGNALLKLPGHTYGDFTWDYLANATAWSHIQAGSLKAAERAHRAAVARIADTAVVQYHRVAADRFREAHRLLFAPGGEDLVWQEMGKRPVHFKDHRRKVPCNQTKIKPM